MQNSTKEHKPEKLKVALIVGASGLIGQHLLRQLLASSTYSKVIILVRKPLNLVHPKLEQWQIDFDDLAAELMQHQLSSQTQQVKTSSAKLDATTNLTTIDHIFCTLGSTIKKAGSKPAFRQVDYHYPLLIAKHFYHQGTALFATVTAMSANKASYIFYNQIKGDIESSLSEIGYSHLGLFRPSMLSGQRDEFRLAEHLGTIMMNALALFIPKKYRVIQAEKVANAMLAYAKNPPLGVAIIQSDQLQNY